MPQAVFPENQATLSALHEISALLHTNHIRFWLRGGWALDFLLGRETRPHGDLDLVVWQRHRHKLRPLLEAAGYAFKDRGLKAQLDFVKGSAKVSMVLLERQKNGDITPAGVPEWRWLPYLLGPERRLYGLSCRTLIPEQLIHEKLTYEGVAPLRPKDHESLRLLRDLVRKNDPSVRFAASPL